MDTRRAKRLLRVSLFGLVMVAMAQWTAFGADKNEDISQGDVVCDQPGTVYRVTGKTDQHTITVKGGTETAPIQIDLNGVEMDLSKQKKSPLTVESGYAEIFIGKDNGDAKNTLTAGQDGYAGLRIEPGAQVKISGKGKLTAKGGNSGAGIGSNSGENISNLTLDGDMTIDATGGSSAAGIGSGHKGKVENLVIKKGTITAKGGKWGAGIGAGDDGTGQSLVIEGGNITATGGADGAGIGGGDGDKSSGNRGDGLMRDIAIKGGNITATGGVSAAGIGGGDKMEVNGLVISGGDIEAAGGEYGPGIGGGKNSAMKNLEINGGTVKATGGEHGAGVGGANHDCSDITISGGTITAKGGGHAAGVGSGDDARMDRLTISGGKITAIGGEKAAGIGAGDHEGGGDGGDLSALKITGGDIEATGGNQGAGIGGSDCGTVDSLSIDQHTDASLSVKATGGGLAAGIGSANHDVRDMSIKLDGGTIIAKGGTQGAGIGAGAGDTGKIDISGKGSIQATGGKRGAGIGAGQNHGSGAITISGSTDASKTRHLRIEAAVDMGSSGDFNTTAAIGSGKASGGNITIKNAVVTVSADHDAASIGGGKFHITEGGAVNKISIENCKIIEEGKNKSAAGIGSGVGGTIKAIEIKDSEYAGASIGSSSWAQHISTPNNVDSITIEGSYITAYAADPGEDVLSWAGIGSGPWGGVGKITIKGSKVHAEGSGGGAGIGSGGWVETKNIVTYFGGDMGDMLIEDSEIKAVGGKGGAGLGGGFDTSTGDITISNSKVEAATNTDTGDGAAAIGGGRAASAGNITIKNGSTVTATGGKHSAGIGCSGDSSALTMMWQTEVKSISIDGSTVTAAGGDGGAGIGSGRGGRLSKSITIKDSVVTASGGPYGAGIGSGSKGEGTRGGDTHDITIKGNSKITATGGNGAAGIGAGLQGGADDITLALTTDADRTWFVKATGGAGAAGIGSGSPNTTDHDVFTQEGYRTNNITINGGYICARGGGDRKNLGSGAGIGGGARKGTLHGFVMTGGYVEAFSGAGDAFDIGHGGEGGVSQAFHDDDFHISGGTVTAQRISTDPDIKISGGSVRSRLSKAKDENGTKVYQTTFQLEQEANTKIYSLKTSKQGYGTKDIFSDGNKKIYLYLPESSTNKATADVQVKSNTQARHYYGTTSTNGTGVLKMDGTISAWRFSPGPVAGEEFTAYLDDEDLKDWNFQFEMAEGSSAEIREVVQATSPGAAVKAYGKSFGDFTIKAKGTKDDPVYWSMSSSCTMNITQEKGRIAITENPSKVYDGQPITDPAVSKNGDGEVRYTYYKGSKAEGAALSSRPTDAGTYTVVAEMAKSGHYTAAASEPMTFTIEKRPVTIGLSATGTDDTVTIQAVIMGAVDDKGKVKFTVGGTTIAKTVSVRQKNGLNGLFVAESEPIEKTSIPEGDYTVTAEYLQDAPENYSCKKNPVSETYHKNLEFRTITGQDSFDKTYGDSAFGLGAGVEAGKAVPGSDKFQYEVMYDAYHEAYPDLPSAAEVDKDSGQVTVKNAGQAIIKITLSDMREHPVYADAVKYVLVKVGQANLKVTSYAENKEGETKTAQYGTLGNLKYELNYQGFKNGDNEKTFTKNHGTLEAVALVPTLGVSNGEQYEIGISKVGAPLKIGNKQYDNVFLSRNYKLELVNGKIAVTPAPLTVKAQDAKGTWSIEPKYAYKLDGLKAWDSEETVFEEGQEPKASLDTGKTGGYSYEKLNPGTYADAVAAATGTQVKNANGKENYTITTEPGDLTIERATAELTVNAVSKVYDGKPAQVTAEVRTAEPLVYDGPEPKFSYYRFGSDGNPSVLMGALASLRRPIAPKSIEPISMEPVNAGNYYAKAEITECLHFNQDAARTLFVISKANPKPDIPDLPDMNMRQGLTLADQALPDGWKWLKPETALDVGNVRRLAQYTPQDTENYRIVYHYLEFEVLGDPAGDDSDNNDNNGGDPIDPSAPSGPTDSSGKDDGTQGTGSRDNGGKSSDPAAGGTVKGDSGNGTSSSKIPTGDESGSWIWLAVIAATASLGTLVALRIRRREQ